MIISQIGEEKCLQSLVHEIHNHRRWFLTTWYLKAQTNNVFGSQKTVEKTTGV